MTDEIIQKLRLLQMSLERTKREVAEQLHSIEVQIDQLLPSQIPEDKDGWRSEISEW